MISSKPLLLLPMLALYMSMIVAQSSDSDSSSLRGSSSTDGIVDSISDSIQVGPSIAAVIAIVGGAA
ncbi:hypothetical protein GQ600_17245 [Phytophthora cactorum]|nr:hypothetical protein GQ600_17245 [Phytophthora cactorum]